MGTPTENGALSVLSRAHKALAIDESVSSRMDAAGLTEDVIFAKLSEQLDCKDTRLLVVDKAVQRHTVKANDIQHRTAIVLLKMRGLLREGGNVNVHADGNVGILVGSHDGAPGPAPAWAPQLPNSNHSASSLNDTYAHSTTITSTLVGTGKRTGGLGHDHRNVRWQAKSVPNSKIGRSVRKSNGNRGTSGCITKDGGKVTRKLARAKSVPAAKGKRK